MKLINNTMQKFYKLLCLFVLAICSTNTIASPIDSLRASKVATNFIALYAEKFEGIEFSYKNTNQANTVMYYVFNLKNSKGYIIVTADDACFPILAYSTESKFDSNNLPIQLDKMLFHRAKEIAYIKEQSFEANNEIKQAWKNIENPNVATRTERTEGVNPLLTTKWDQSPFYNDLCPYDIQEKEKAVTGCVATAMAQVMKYHNYPKTGQGIYTYIHDKYGRLGADFSSTTYNWANMPNTINNANIAVATLMYHCGVSLDMNYGISKNGGSSAVTSQVATALQKYFNYVSTIKYVENKNYSQAEWIKLLRSELDAKRPMQYRGSGTGGGHSFVCDGYDDNNFFHFNWGWGGSSDGFFNLNALNPGSLGIGGGTGGFNSGQGALIGIQPPAPSTVPVTSLQLNKKLTINPSPIGFGNDVTVTFNIANRGTTQFQGDYAVALFDSKNEFVSFIGEISANRTLNAGFTYTNDLIFTQKSVFLSEGDYSIAAYYREPQKEWQLLRQPTFDNPVKVQVSGITVALKMFGTVMKVNTEPIFQTLPFEVTLNIANFETTIFEGDLRVSLYDLQGTLIKEIENKTNVSLDVNKTFSNALIFRTTGLDIPVGTYMLAPTYKRKTGTAYFALGSYKDNAGVNYPNLIRVTVAAKPLVADKFEVNNTETQASNLPISFTNTTAVVNTESSNLHTGADIDHYKLDLPAGFDYEITARVHDKDDTGNGKTYTADVLFSYKVGSGSYTDAFDVSINDNNGKATVVNGGTMIFKVAPYFAGDKGTYLLDIEISRKQIIQPSIVITSPKNADKWQTASTQDITWTDNITENVRIDLLKGNNVFVQTLTSSTASNGLFSWTIPNTVADGTDYKIGIMSITNSSVQSVSPSFTIFKMVTGIEDELFGSQIKVYPNPTTDILTVQFPENAKIETVKLLNVTGQEVFSINKQNLTEKLNLTLSNYAAGVYYLYVISDKKVGIKKISLVK